MKRIYITASILIAISALASCTKFLERLPENTIASDKFFQSENDLVMYTNGLIETAMPTESAIALGEDLYTDLCGTKASKTFYQKDYYNPSMATGWSASNWSFLRQVAFMTDNLPRMKGKISEEKYRHYKGVAYFWRAFSTFNKVKSFSDCFFINHVIDLGDTAVLYGQRQSREYVMHRVIEDLQYACDSCLADGANIKTNGRVYINKEVARAFAMRVFLYEGTYRKYHDCNPSTGQPWNPEYESSEDLLKLVVKYGKEMIGKYSLIPNYRDLFVSSTLPAQEVIWGRSFSEELGIKHSTTFTYCSATSSQLYSPTKDYVMMFLGTDGKPAKGDVSITKEFENRDKRLAACVLAPGQKMTDQSGNSVDFPLNFAWTRTGYNWMKWILPQYKPMSDANKTSTNSLPILRYGEVLLNYAEALVELGQMTPALWNVTIGALRVRAGVTSIYPDDNAADPFLQDYYTRDLKHPANLSKLMLEVRRERVTEMMLEQNSRYDDLMRWNMGDLIERRYDGNSWRGIYITPAEAASGFDFNGKHYTISKTKNTSETNYRIASDFTLSNGDYGYLQYNFPVSWDDKMYTKPIPQTALNVNPNLGQNEGWQWY